MYTFLIHGAYISRDLREYFNSSLSLNLDAALLALVTGTYFCKFSRNRGSEPLTHVYTTSMGTCWHNSLWNDMPRILSLNEENTALYFSLLHAIQTCNAIFHKTFSSPNLLNYSNEQKINFSRKFNSKMKRISATAKTAWNFSQKTRKALCLEKRVSASCGKASSNIEQPNLVV